MGLETGTYLDALVPTNPASTDGLAQADDHIRLLKITLTNTLPNLSGAVSATQAELNVLDGITSSTSELNVLDGITATTAELNFTGGVTSSIQTQMNTKAPLASPTFTGTLVAPTADITTANVTTVDLGDWTVTQTGTNLVFSTGGVGKMKLDASGNLTVVGDITGFGSI
jgi:hypothetical protein